MPKRSHKAGQDGDCWGHELVTRGQFPLPQKMPLSAADGRPQDILAELGQERTSQTSTGSWQRTGALAWRGGRPGW